MAAAKDDKGKIDPAQLKKILAFVLGLVSLFGKDQQVGLKAASPTDAKLDPKAVEAELFAALSPTQLEPGKMGGPMTDALILSALTKLADLAKQNVGQATKILSKVLDKLPFPLP